MIDDITQHNILYSNIISTWMNDKMDEQMSRWPDLGLASSKRSTAFLASAVMTTVVGGCDGASIRYLSIVCFISCSLERCKRMNGCMNVLSVYPCSSMHELSNLINMEEILPLTGWGW